MAKLQAYKALALAICIIMANGSAFAAQTTLRVEARVIQCGPAEQITQACLENSVCCNFVDQIAAAKVAEENPERFETLSNAMQAAKIERLTKEATAEVKFKVTTARDTFFAGQDADESGNVTMQEFLAANANATPDIFAKLDRNNDGTLSKPELSKYRAAINS